MFSISYYQHQVSHLRDESYGFEIAQDRVFFLHHLLFELGLGDDIYERLTIENNKIMFKMENSQKCDLHMLIDVLHEHIHKSKMDMDIQAALEKIKCLQGQLVNFIMGSHDLYDFQYDDFNKPFVDTKIFMRTYSSDKNRIFQVLLDCVNEYQSPTEQLISHLILMNYSYFVLKRKKSGRDYIL